ncbi:MAG: ABC transporter substrate-binding protein [Angelakisella sp.]
MKKNFIAFLLAALVMLPLGGCQKKQYEISIAEQFGIAYAPLAIMKEKKLLEEKLPGITVNWKQFGGPTAIREGMLSGDIDIGFMGCAPVLVGIDNGMPWKYVTGISSNEVAIVTDKPYVKTLADFKPQDKIAILSPACTQHVLLCMLAQKQLGDPNALDTQLVSMSHPDAANALLADTEIAAHVATPPYIGTELAAGMHTIATGDEIMGKPFTFITGVALIKFHDEHPTEYNAFIEALEQSIDYINNNMDEAVKLLAPTYGIGEAELKAQMTYNGTIYSSRLEGIPELSAAMQQMGFTKGNPAFGDIVFPNVNGGERP